MEVGGDAVALITIINPPVNSLSFDVIRSLKENFDQALRTDDVKAIVVTDECDTKLTSNVIGAGAKAARKPSVAAIEGFALGGGLEVAMVCHARISAPTARLGLPELPLGIIPGFGGTQRLPRLVGIKKSLEMMLTSKLVKGDGAYDFGLVDVVVAPDQLISTARRWALDIFEHRKPWVSTLYRTNKLEPLGEARKIFKFARTQARKQAPNLEHPIVCINAIEEGVVSDPWVGLLKEAEVFDLLAKSDTSKSLVRIFFAQRATSKVPGVTDLGLMPKRVNKVAILGGGLMGSRIATALILSDYLVVLKEVNEKFLEAGINRVRANLQSRLKKGKMTQEKFDKAMFLLKGALDYESFKDDDMVIKAVIENVSLKQQIFSDLEKYCPSHCILASNTSTIDLNLIGELTKSQDRIVGAHFFSPAQVMPLLEIVRTNKTSPQVIVDLLDIGKMIKKTPVVVDPYLIDREITKFGMPMGPFRLADLVGFGVVKPPAKDSTCMMIKTELDQILNWGIRFTRSVSSVAIEPKFSKLSEKDIVEMIFFSVVNEACQVFAEGIAVKAADLDVAAVMGMGFPPYRGGIMFWADSIGSKYIYSRLEEWSKLYGEVFKPCAFLAERASKGAPLVECASGTNQIKIISLTSSSWWALV
ncbi:hypothetical protein Pint_24488 [Pistacia integerrima]|uniref:Uncharacterized protein n=1 Tax=Pistacia integerrima TaxID=434235 RepID=A0ACC0YDQ6_9ROSI|nr:hypothetical protein Pint_24488 [Pistacia integerrima]